MSAAKIPDHAALPFKDVEKLLPKCINHMWAGDAGGAPVVAVLVVCMRCGYFEVAR